VGAASERTGPSFAGTRRRLRALAARSWSPQAMERATGIPELVLRRGLDGYEITPELAQAVASAYDRLWDREPPITSRDEREAARESRSCAVARGWAPPMAWDDDQIDLPDGRPAKGWKPHRTTRRAVDLVEDAEFVRQHDGYRDASIPQVAIRLGVPRNRLEQAYSRARRHAARRAANGEAEVEAEAG
jgi:hypothetical protein